MQCVPERIARSKKARTPTFFLHCTTSASRRWRRLIFWHVRVQSVDVHSVCGLPFFPACLSSDVRIYEKFRAGGQPRATAVDSCRSGTGFCMRYSGRPTPFRNTRLAAPGGLPGQNVEGGAGICAACQRFCIFPSPIRLQKSAGSLWPPICAVARRGVWRSRACAPRTQKKSRRARRSDGARATVPP